MQKIRKAIIPVAGLGTRFLPATKAMPKEMLPVVDKPVVQYLVEEAVASGITDIIFITGRGKRAIEDHFDVSFELEETLVEHNKRELLKAVQSISSLARFTYVRQSLPLGDGHAVLQAAHLVGDESVLVIFGDSLYDAKIAASRQLMDAFETYGHTIIGLAPVKKKEVSKFGVFTGPRIDRKTIRITRAIEKPSPATAPSNLVTPGRYLITPEVFRILAKIKKGRSGECRLIDAFDLMLSRKKPLYGRILEGTWLDTGNKLNFIKATIHLGLKDPELRRPLKTFLKQYVS